MADTFNKKALQQKRAKKQKDKLERREERKTNNDKGKSLEEMTVYVDEYGNLTNVHPDNQKRKKINTAIYSWGQPLLWKKKSMSVQCRSFLWRKATALSQNTKAGKLFLYTLIS
jgi:hypothetical protein